METTEPTHSQPGRTNTWQWLRQAWHRIFPSRSMKARLLDSVGHLSNRVLRDIGLEHVIGYHR